MGWRSKIIAPYAKFVHRKLQTDAKKAVDIQHAILSQNVAFAKNTLFGKDHQFDRIYNYQDYKKQVRLRSYESLKPYIEKTLNGERDVLWPGLPKYIVGTSGTTSGIKYIPLSRESIPIHLRTATYAGLNYAYQNNLMDMFDGKLIFLTGSPELDRSGHIPVGRLSGIVNHEIPRWLRSSQVRSYKTNCIKDWKEKVLAIAEETQSQDLRMISGIPPWVVMYLEALLKVTGKNNVIDVFPNLQMLIHGGVNYLPYEGIFKNLIGKDIDFVETYPSTEGFVAFQDAGSDDGLLLNINGGVFFEFVPVDEIYKEMPPRLSIADVQTNIPYALIINNNAGLWGSVIGDIVEFISITPYRLRITGRISQFISAFGEHVIGSEVEKAMALVSTQTGNVVKEFTAAPFVHQQGSYHHWLVEFQDELNDNQLRAFADQLDQAMQKINFHYEDLIKGKVINPLKLTEVPSGSFVHYLASKGKLGGQNKVPRLSNSHEIVNDILDFVEKNIYQNINES